MAGGKETTRQRMINIMYLVLLAMLALNVSDTILDAFKNINDSLDTSKNNVNTSINQLFSAFENSKLKEEPARAQPIYDKAKEAQKAADDLNNYIESIKKEFTKAGDGIDPETEDLVNRSNQDIAQNIMINQKKADELKKRINATREKLISLLDKNDRANVSFSLEAKDPARKRKGNWQETYFGEGTPLTAAMTILTKLQTDTKNAEAEVVKKLFGNMDKAQVNLDQFAAVAVAPTSYVIQGQPYTAEVFLTASDSRSTPDITVNGSKLSVKDGKGTYTGGTSSVGQFTWVGTVRVRQTDGQVKEYKTQPQTYQVAKPSASVSSTKLNVIYAGIPNPFTVSAAGFPLESIRASISGGSMSGGNGNYNVNVPGSMVGQEVSINVSASNAGKTVSLGSQKFRVKGIPAPVAKVGGRAGGDVASVQLKSETEIEADLDDFPFDVKFKILRYKLTIIKPRSDAVTIPGSGGSFAGAVKGAINSITPGTRVFFEDIVSVGPDGRQKILPSLAFSVK
ncbi:MULTISPECIES: gliding motility protein GldM [unclassified Pedobacter]|uniref:type IX secretion system motor protein PorM/GldM n=2 Tax=Pedobacter TaxID=84567 RepID=UPI00141F9B62|nr:MULTISPECIES: gliding motility protein GldM [unclassified Pedobacter]NII85835.1 gliding motility-associated protein GldM [Pedobacter sp. SG908]NMN39251.1 gliding motility-associated protein GldM [Pedobacter sp. SG918]